MLNVQVYTPEIVDENRDVVLNDRRIKVGEVAGTADISTERVHHILYEYMGMKQLSP